MSPYAKSVFVLATLAWLFDCLDQKLFLLARGPAMEELAPGWKNQAATLSTTWFMIGWATGGMIFGSLGDRFGRVRFLGITVLMYSVATGLSALSASVWDFSAYRFLTGLGVGGVFGLAVALVADTAPDVSRPRALGFLQSIAGLGNIGGALLGLLLAVTTPAAGYWKWLFLVGAVPALLTAVIHLRLKEPEKWIKARDAARLSGRHAGSYLDLFGGATTRRHAVFGTLLCSAGVVGLWGIGFFSFELVSDIIQQSLTAKGVAVEEIGRQKYVWASINLLVFAIGATAGMVAFTRVAQFLSRKRTFVIFFLGALASTVYVYQTLDSTADILWKPAVMGFFQLSVFAGFSMYLPELFPVRLRATGTSFCYNVGRYLAAAGPFTLGVLLANLSEGKDALGKIGAFRDACSWMSLIFLLGIAVLPFLPETKDQPLMED